MRLERAPAIDRLDPAQHVLDRRSRAPDPLVSELIEVVEAEAPEDPALVEQAWAELEARIARADADPDDGIDWTHLRAELTSK